MSSYALRQFVSGALHPKGNVGDFQHAARLFVDSDLRLAPKRKFSFHVVFNINPGALKTLNFQYQHQTEINMLVKTCELPKFTLKTETLNQYNRKKVVNLGIDYNPINIRFHDDNLGVVGQLWQNYYNYYYADVTAANVVGGYNRNAMQGPGFFRSRYGLDNNSSMPFFTDITIYQMAKRAWYSYKLINPVITSWSHDALDYSSSQSSEQAMTLAYEAVTYNTGYVVPGQNPPGFGGPDHYDTMPSPISLAGGGTKTLFGQAGVLAGIEAVFGAVGSGQAFSSVGNFLGTAITAINTYQNAKALTNAGVRAEVTNMAVRGLTSLSRIGLSGLSNTSFPVNNPVNTTVATQRNITGGP
jgi:hypothetical protein